MSNIYYIYAYIRKSNGIPYYIGKGMGNRAYEKNHNVSVPKDKSKIVIMESGLTEIGALALERRYIRWFGRKDNGTGVLRNMTDGGEGSSGRLCAQHTRKKIREGVAGINHPLYHKKHSEETKKKMSKSRIGRKLSPETKKRISIAKTGKRCHIETSQKISISRKGKLHSEETKKKMSVAKKGKPRNYASPGMSGKFHSNETKLKISQSIHDRMKK